MSSTRNNFIAFLKVFPIVLLVSLGLFDIVSRVVTGTPAFSPEANAEEIVEIENQEPIVEEVISPLTPTHLSIPAINVDSAVEKVGRTKDGNMANPSSMKTTGWYSLGYKPGEVGNAVIDGHLDNALGTRAVFARLEELQNGDSVYVEDSTGAVLHFIVRESRSYEYNDAPLDLIFGSQGKRQLVLVTCDGVWNPQKKTYDKRLVVFAELAK